MRIGRPDSGAPHPHRRDPDRRQRPSGREPHLRSDVRAVVVQGRRQRFIGFELGDNGVHVRVTPPGAEIRPIIGRQPLFGDSGKLEQQHVPGLLVLLEPRPGAEGRRVPDRQRHQMVDAVTRERREPPRHRRSPIMPDDVCLLHPGIAHDCQHVAGQRLDAICVDRRRLVGAAVPAHVRHDHPESRPRQRRHLVAPQPARVGKAVQQHDGPALSRDLVVDPHAAGFDPHVAE